MARDVILERRLEQRVACVFLLCRTVVGGWTFKGGRSERDDVPVVICAPSSESQGQ